MACPLMLIYYLYLDNTKVSDKKPKTVEPNQVKPKQQRMPKDDVALKLKKLSEFKAKLSESKKFFQKFEDVKNICDLKTSDVKTVVSSEAVKCSISKIQNVQSMSDTVKTKKTTLQSQQAKNQKLESIGIQTEVYIR
jgi:hypothetical protein